MKEVYFKVYMLFRKVGDFISDTVCFFAPWFFIAGIIMAILKACSVGGMVYANWFGITACLWMPLAYILGYELVRAILAIPVRDYIYKARKDEEDETKKH